MTKTVVHFRGHMRPLRHPRTLAEAFPSERAPAIERYLSMKARHRVMRAVRRFVAWLMGERA